MRPHPRVRAPISRLAPSSSGRGPSRRFAAVCASLCASAWGLSGCGPVTFSFTFGGEPGRVTEVAVAEDEKASDKVLLIDVRGLIADDPGEGLAGLLFDAGNPVDELTYRLELAARDPKVRAVILRINSPGGTVAASDMMYREVRRFAERTGKPVLASLGEVAASGGYYLALAADEIVAEPASITGSIGVIIPTLNVSEGLSRIGIRARNVKSGPNKDMADPLIPPRDEHYAVLQSLVDEYTAQFRSLVTARRTGIRPDQLDELTDGRVVTGAQAVRSGLADHTGGVREAFDAAKARAGIASAKLVKYHSRGPRPRSPYAAGPPATPEASGRSATEVNLLQLRLGSGVLGTGTPNAYYLWAP